MLQHSESTQGFSASSFPTALHALQVLRRPPAASASAGSNSSGSSSSLLPAEGLSKERRFSVAALSEALRSRPGDSLGCGLGFLQAQTTPPASTLQPEGYPDLDLSATPSADRRAVVLGQTAGPPEPGLSRACRACCRACSGLGLWQSSQYHARPEPHSEICARSLA